MSSSADLSGRNTPPPGIPLSELGRAVVGVDLGREIGRALNPPPPATLPEMQAWARRIMRSRAPDFVIGDDYLLRWYVVPRNAFTNLYLHEIRRSDDDRALHDHPWANSSYLLEGRYREHTPEGVFERVAGEFVRRPAEALHRLEVYPGESAVSLFATGPKVREWGFACPQGWRHWREFTAPGQAGKVGRGCGE